MPSPGRRGCWTEWCQVILFGASVLVILAERTAIAYCLVYYLWFGHTLWAALTLALALPGSIVQVLSFLWYYADGERRRCLLALVHLLHLGIYKRFGDCMSSVWHMQRSTGKLGAAVMQQADVSALRLLEALLFTLPQTLLHTYILVTSDVGLLSPVALCCGLCLLSLSWALVLYSRACCLIRPGHLAMPPAALLCQLLWRVCMLGSRIASLVVFARIFHWWAFGVAGFHWLTASFWLVSQQADICARPWHWRLFNCTLGAVHVFFFLNVKDGPSRFRMTGFYLVMLLENATLVLAASDFLNGASWESMSIPTAVMCSFLLGMASVILYYRFLHPKSTEICQRFGQGHVSRACLEREESSYSVGDKGLPISTIQAHSGFTFTGSLPERPASRGPIPGGRHGHHHWLLIRLALKTGDVGRIDLAYGSGGVTAMLDTRQGIPDVKAVVVAATPDLERKCGMAPLSDMKEDFHSASEAASTDATQEDGESLEMESPLGSPVSEFKRSSPEGKSGLGGSPEVNFCPTESSSTLYFSAEPQSPSSASNTGLDREPAVQILSELSPISGEAGPSRNTRGLLGRVEPCYTSTPKLNSASQEPTAGHLAGSRRLFVSSRKK
ncbi:XK-related protein 5a [Brienomyrus brachyistius]|uniref:XK-related protein 5a n=1 Tax=Brienomyrus brachyistius TaxID=42636 RepID=UPI0020B1B438|nr:XK-related protein 5a [Brienomyrus brachyistius]